MSRYVYAIKTVSMYVLHKLLMHQKLTVREGLRAETAGKRLLSGMRAAMPDQI